MKPFLAVLVLLAAPRDAKDDVQRALQKLAAAENFSWMAMTIEESDVKAPEEAEWFEGQSTRSGWRKVSKPGSKATEDAWVKDDRIALRTPEGWKAVDLEAVVPGQKPDKIVRRAQEFHQARDPLRQATILSGRGQSLVRHEDGLISGQVAALDGPRVLEHALTSGNKIPEGAAFRVNFRIKDGILASYELVVTYRSVRKDGREVENVLSMAVEFSEVGTTALDIPEEARKALQ